MENNNLRQLVISGILGDGHLKKSGSISFSCIFKEYLEFKEKLVGEMSTGIKRTENNGYSKGVLYSFRCKVSDIGKEYANKTLAEQVKDLDELGLAMWLYDDGSLHKKELFFNINSHAFSKEDQENILIPLLNKFNIFPKILKEKKKDGREFHYLYLKKYHGVYEISRILRKYPVACYSYKLIPEEECRRWDILNNTFDSYKINSREMNKILRAEVDNFEEYLKTLHVSSNGYVSISDKYKHTDNPYIVNLSKIIT